MSIEFDWNLWKEKKDCFPRYRTHPSKLIYGAFSENLPDISVAIPTFRRSDFLKESLDSIIAQQGDYAYEILVVDNDSDVDDATDELMTQYCQKHANILYYRNEKNLGLYGNWNRCLELVRTEWYIMLHDDDELCSDYMNTMLPYLKRNDLSAGVLAGFSYKMYTDIKQQPPVTMIGSSLLSDVAERIVALQSNKLVRLTMDNFINGTVAILTPVIHKQKAMDLGGFDEDTYPVTDYAFWAKMCYHYGAVFLPHRVYKYRIGLNANMKYDVMFGLIEGMKEITYAMAKTAGYSEKKAQYYSNASVVIAENWNSYYFHPTFDFNKMRNICGVPEKYGNKTVKKRVLLKNRIQASALLVKNHI